MIWGYFIQKFIDISYYEFSFLFMVIVISYFHVKLPSNLYIF